jgi:hypothetical protein
MAPRPFRGLAPTGGGSPPGRAKAASPPSLPNASSIGTSPPPRPLPVFSIPASSDLSDPFLLPNMGTAVDRLFKARSLGEALVIYGDYDVDGVTSTALLIETSWSTLGWQVSHFLPHRMDEGYGLSPDGVENCLGQHPVSLMLAVDCGSTAVEAIAKLRAAASMSSFWTIIRSRIPPPDRHALVNPRVGGEGTRAWNFAPPASPSSWPTPWSNEAVNSAWPAAIDFDLKLLLDLVALGTIADLVPLRRENRILVRAGLEGLNQTQRPGLQALCEIAQITSTIGGYEVGFLLAPRLNAAGRLEDACEALDLLLADDYATRDGIAQQPRRPKPAAATDRKGHRRRGHRRPGRAVRSRTDFVIVEGEMPWHIGVVGIVASRVLTTVLPSHDHRGRRRRVVARFRTQHRRLRPRRPAGMRRAAAAARRTCHGSRPERRPLQPRRPPGAGSTNWPGTTLRPEQLHPPLRLDCRGWPLRADRGTDRRTRPPATDRPGQSARTDHRPGNLAHDRPPQRVGRDRQHAKFWVTDGRVTREAIWYAAGDRAVPSPGRFDLACVAHLHEFNGRRSVQLKVLDWRPPGLKRTG